MKHFIEVSFDPAQCRRELSEFRDLLHSGADLRERSDLQAFFKQRPQLTAFIGTYAPQVGPADLLAFEFPLFGDFAADVVLGNRERGAFCLVELEDASAASIFKKPKGKSTKEWSKRFEHGFSHWSIGSTHLMI